MTYAPSSFWVIAEEDEYKSWDDGVGKSLKETLTNSRRTLLSAEREIAKYLEELDRADAFNNANVAYKSMSNAIKSNTAEDI